MDNVPTKLKKIKNWTSSPLLQRTKLGSLYVPFEKSNFILNFKTYRFTNCSKGSERDFFFFLWWKCKSIWLWVIFWLPAIAVAKVQLPPEIFHTTFIQGRAVTDASKKLCGRAKKCPSSLQIRLQTYLINLGGALLCWKAHWGWPAHTCRAWSELTHSTPHPDEERK